MSVITSHYNSKEEIRDMNKCEAIWDNYKKKLCRKMNTLNDKGYIIPVNTLNGDLFTQNILINSIVFIADLICIIITLYGMKQKMITLFGVVTYSLYAMTEQIKIIKTQFSVRKGRNGFFRLKNWSFKILIPPNIINLTFMFVIFCILVFSSINCIAGGTIKDPVYVIFVILSFSFLFYVKVKYMIYDSFGILNWNYIEE